MERLGIAFSGGPGPAEIVDCIVLAESLGYESAWVAEGHGGDQFDLMDAIAAGDEVVLDHTLCANSFALFGRGLTRFGVNIAVADFKDLAVAAAGEDL